MERTELLEQNLARQLNWINAAEAKISPLLAIDTAMLGALSALAPKGSEWDTYITIFTLLASGLLLISLFSLSYAAFPRTDGPKGSLIYFRGITEITQEDFANRMTNLNEKEYELDLISQCYRNAEIANKKYCCIKNATKLLFIAVVPWLITIYLMFGKK